MKNFKGKQWVKIASLSVPIIALVITTLAGLEAGSQVQIEEVLTTIIVIVAGALGVTGVVANNDKEEQE